MFVRLLAFFLATSFSALGNENPSKAYGKLKTRWAAEVDSANPLPEHPRPQLARKKWTNLNGQWDYCITEIPATAAGELPQVPKDWQGKITVPFCVESQLSGVQEKVGQQQRLWYRRSITSQKLARGERLLLHFDAVDWETMVFINGQLIYAHRGGYDPFEVDITDFLTETPTQEIAVSVWDPTDGGKQPRGKQSRNPKGIFYTSVTGIWQTVWMEVVPRTRLTGVKISGNIDTGEIKVIGKIWGQAGFRTLEVTALDGDKEVAKASGHYDREQNGFVVNLKIPNAKLWSPESPHLYDLKLRVLQPDEKTVLDEATSYCALRKVSLEKDSAGHLRFAINGEPTFLLGLLDQGWWPDGLYTAPTDEALRSDIEATKAMGFNIARKHVKVEPARWYYWADKLGLLVWQDMPNGKAGGNPVLQQEKPAAPEDAKQFRTELEAIVDRLEHHPSVIVWTIFNEGWGQHQSTGLIKWLQKRDPSRIVGGPSGWQDYGVGQLLDLHRYPGPSMPAPTEAARALVLSEYGGLKMVAPDHLWQEKDNWGYVAAKDQVELRALYQSSCDKMQPLIRAGLAAAIYTQTTDVETEVNGLLTYDRSVNKAGADWLAKANAPLFKLSGATKPRVLLSTGGTWSHTTKQPAEDWATTAFDDSKWKKAPAPFGDPAAKAITPWTSDKLWLRRSFEIVDPQAHDLMLKIQNNDSATIYINGKLARRCGGFSPLARLTLLGEKGQQALVKGKNVIAVEIENNKHPHFLDIGLIDMRPVE